MKTLFVFLMFFNFSFVDFNSNEFHVDKESTELAIDFNSMDPSYNLDSPSSSFDSECEVGCSGCGLYLAFCHCGKSFRFQWCESGPGCPYPEDPMTMGNNLCASACSEF